MYLFLREDRTSNFHVWSEYDLAVLGLTLVMVARMLWERCCCLG